MTKLDSASEFLSFRHGPDYPPDQKNSSLISQSLLENSFKIDMNSIFNSENAPKIPMNYGQLESNFNYQVADQNGESSCPEEQSLLWEIESESSLSDSGSNLFSKDLELTSFIWSDNLEFSGESGSDDSPGQPSVKDDLLPCLSEGEEISQQVLVIGSHIKARQQIYPK